MKTVQEQLELLINTKNNFKSRFRVNGIEVASDLPFSEYPYLIDELAIPLEETTTDQDLLQMADVVTLIGYNTYENKVYTDEEIQTVHALADKIIGGMFNE